MLIATPHVRTLSSADDVMLNRHGTGARVVGAEAEVAGGISFELSRLARTSQSQRVMDLDSERLLLEVTHGGVTLVVNQRIHP